MDVEVGMKGRKEKGKEGKRRNTGKERNVKEGGRDTGKKGRAIRY